MKKIIIIKVLITLFLVLAAQAQGAIITPSTPGIILGSSLSPATGPSNCEAGCVYQAFGLTNNGSLQLLYKADVGSADSGSFASSYDTTFSNTPTDPEDALIKYVAGSAIACPACYLAIKDGNHNPTYYFYNLNSLPSTSVPWNGTEDLDLRDFWVGPGAISHVSIWGASGNNGTTPTGIPVPEPYAFVLLGFGLISIGFSRISRKAKVA